MCALFQESNIRTAVYVQAEGLSSEDDRERHVGCVEKVYICTVGGGIIAFKKNNLIMLCEVSMVRVRKVCARLLGHMNKMATKSIYELRHEKHGFLHICENKGADQLHSNCSAAISAFVLATKIGQFLYFLNPSTS